MRASDLARIESIKLTAKAFEVVVLAAANPATFPVTKEAQAGIMSAAKDMHELAMVLEQEGR